MTYRNAPRMQPPPLFLTGPKAAGGANLPVMQDDSIHWNGEPVAIVLAETQEQADYAASLIEVAYESSPPRTFEEARAHPRTPDSLVGQAVEVLVGDAEAALDRCPPLRRPDVSDAAPQPQRDRAPRGHPRLGRRRAHRPRRQPGGEGPRLDVRAGLRDRRGAGACDLAVCRRRVRRQDAVVSPPGRGGRLEGRRAVPSGSRSRARASIGWSAVARTPSSGSPSAPMPTVASRRSSIPASRR